MTNEKKHVGVIGAGPMGLACAYELLQQGHKVTIFEAGDRIGGMTASFDFDGLNIERFYHFICRGDVDYFRLLDDLGIKHTLRWTRTSMGYFYNGKLYEWGSLKGLLQFPDLNLIQKFRYGINVLYIKNIRDWSKLEYTKADLWLKKWLGEKAWQVLWERLFRLKFFEYTPNLSASWIAARVQRVANSRNGLHEELGYLEGGSDTLLDALDETIRKMGGEIKLSSPVQEVVIKDNQVRAVRFSDQEMPFDNIISTVPMPYVPRMIPDLPKTESDAIKSINNIAVVTVKFKLKHAICQHFWINVSDPSMEIPGIIEYSNLNPLDDHIVYIPYYMPQTHEKYKWEDQYFIDENIAYLKRINTDFDESWIKATHVSRYQYAQTICPPGFADTLPPVKSSVNGLFMADTAYYHPEDRSIHESVKLGREIALMID